MDTVEQKTMENRYNLPYNWVIPEHSRRFRYKLGLWQSTKNIAPNLIGLSVLDAGCGDGWYSSRILKSGAFVTGIDYSSRAIDFAKAIIPKAVFFVGSITKMPFADKKFDTVISIQVLEHIPPAELKGAVKEFSRVLKDNGICIVSVPSILRPKSKAHFQHFTINSFKNEINDYFVIDHVTGFKRESLIFLFLEKISENRFWFSSLLGAFCDKIFFSFFAYTGPTCAQNLVFRLKKKNSNAA